MKRYFTIGWGYFIFSIFPILSWLAISITLGDSRLANIFSLTYPLQMIYSLLKAIFATGANIKAIKEKNNNTVFSSMFYGIVFSFLVYGLFIIFLDPYIKFMNMEVEVYRNFALYSIIQLFIQNVFSFIIEKMYFEDKEKKANFHLLVFNALNFFVLITLSLMTSNQIIIITFTLIVIALYTFALLLFELRKFKFDFNILSNFKYESMTIFSYIFMFIIYFVGFSNIFNIGIEYMVAINFVSLVTDANWDALSAIDTITKVDISKEKYNYRRNLRHSFLYTLAVSSLSVVLFFSLFKVYHVNLKIGVIYLTLQIVDMILDCYLTQLSIFTQLKYSAKVNTINTMITKVLRTSFSVLLPTAFCTDIGQVAGTVLGIILCVIVRLKNFKLTKDGNLIQKANVKPISIKNK